MLTAAQALARLQEGNRRFVENAQRDTMDYHARRTELTAGQKPFAVVLGCSDSRVPLEIVFDQGLGDLFVIRVAGNIVARSQIGSVEFAVTQFEIPLVVVLGHTQCGAVEVTLSELRRPSAHQSRNLRAIVERIRPAVLPLLDSDIPLPDEALLRKATRANVIAATHQLRHGSDIIEDLIDRGTLSVVGAEYSLETGEVALLDTGA